MPAKTRKLSDILKEMSHRLFREPRSAHSSEALHVALMFANIAWNESVGLVHDRNGYRQAWESIEAENPELWSEFKSNDVNGMIDELVQYKQQKFSKDMRRILVCGIPNGSIHVEWLPPAKPGVDTTWEMQLFGLVKSGEREQAIRFLQQTKRMSPLMAAAKVIEVAIMLGMQ